MTDINILIAFTAGISSFLSPCVLPLIPSYLFHFRSFFGRGAHCPSRKPHAVASSMELIPFVDFLLREDGPER